MNQRTLATLGAAVLALAGAAALGYQRGLRTAPPSITAPGIGSIESVSQDPAPTGSVSSPVPDEQILHAPVLEARPEIKTLADTLALPTDFLQTAALYGLIERANIKDLKRYAGEAKALASSTDRSAALAIIYLRFSEMNPKAAVDHLYASGAPGRDNVLYTVFFSWAKRDLDAAIARSKRISNSTDRAVVANAIMRAFGDRDLAFIGELASRVAPPGVTANHYVIEALVNQAARDPVGALQAAMQLSSADRRMAAYRVAQVWSRNDPWAAYRYADNITDVDVAKQLRAGSLHRMAEQDPEQTMQLLGTDITRQEKSTIISAAMGRLAEQDPQRALSLANGIDDYQLRSEGLSALFSRWGQADPRAAATALDGIANPQLRQNVAWGVASAYARLEPKEALAWAQRLDGRIGDVYRMVINEIAQSDPEIALQALAGLRPSNNRSQLQSTVLSYLANSDPAIAITYAEDMSPGQGRDQALASIASSWANSDPVSAMEWVLTRAPSEQRTLLSSIAYSLAAEDPQLALGYVERLDGALRNEWIGQVIGSFAYQDPETALSWLADHRDEPNHDEWLQTVISGLAGSDPTRAVALISDITDPTFARTAREQIAWQWANQDPEAAGRWIAGLPPDQRDPSLISSVVSSWQSFVPDAAQRWVRGLEAGAQRDAGLTALINNTQLSTTDVRRILGQINDDDMRQQAAQQHAFQLMQTDPEGARAFIDSIDLTDEAREWLNGMISEVPPTG